ncbi:MAG TPA: adenylyltransferase/cytidyltransferase family protein [Thermoanaerobaculia bacterium]|nr:adenylyltransferase/cytidyltransferase family protein [Thermoanaerobaculia bacterium]HUM30500.1 adenylyltransferase/cytidyltransferase family protein [Thermoanaerobaculia bacterium]HXK68633.1 adenylyltransferase/cytidyltransferase family protein [Thermoanaerobaculia bacterium]
MPAEILDRSEATNLGARLRNQNLTIVFANGCFDVLHVGHIRYLAAARAAGDVLVVGMNSDESVRRLKGEGRPVMPLMERMEVLSHLEPVDFLIPFEEDSPRELILELRPHIQCKGTDYTEENVPEREVMESIGGRVLIVGDPKDHSTTDILKTWKRP